MTTGSILLTVSITLLITLFIIRPFLLPRQRPPRITPHQRLHAEKEALLAQIHALDFDAETDKQDPEIYQLEREQLLQQATSILQQIEETTDTDQAIETAVARLIQQQNLPDQEITCPTCTSPTRPTDHFCPNCGQKLQPTTQK